MPAAIARHIEREAKRKKTSFSAIIAELVERAPGDLPYAGIIDDDPDLSLKIDEVLSRVGD